MSLTGVPGLVCIVSMMLFFLTQGEQWTTNPDKEVEQLPPDCCFKVSNASINERVIACYEQRQKTPPCNAPIKAYIMITVNGSQWCVDPEAKWLPQRLSRLERRNITCTAMI